MALTLDGTNGIVSSGSITTQSATGVIFSDSSALTAASSPFVLKNRIINGAMVIDQRNAGASITASDGSFGVDRFKTAIAGSGVFTMQQSSTAPTGFSYSQLLTITTADTSIAASDEYSYRQFIEGYNTADLAWGTANAKTITLSFWVRSSVTGTYAVGLRNSAADRAYPATYTISSANTWEQKTITIAGDTSGTWLTTNGAGIGVVFSLGAGSNYQGTANSWNSANTFSTSSATQWISNAGATFYITGVQLEVGSTATPFERRLYNQELANCQRYYYKALSDTQYGFFGVATLYSASGGSFYIPFPVTMRAVASSINYSSLMTSDYLSGFSAAISAASISGSTSRYVGTVEFTATSAGSTGQFKQILANNNTSAFIGFSAEL
jgi:hypothetical protein